MVKILIILFSFGLSTLTTLLMHLSEGWQIAVGIIGFGLAYIVGFALIFFLILIILGLKVRKGEIATKYSSFYRRVFSMYQVFGLSFFGIRLTTNGLNKIPKNTNFILVQNHRSNLDPMFTDAILRKYPLIFVGKESLFHLPFFGKIISHIGYIKLTRNNSMKDAIEIARGLSWVSSGTVSLGLYPEGTRNRTYPNPVLLDFKDEAFAIIKKSNKPIVITVFNGTEKVNHHLLTKIHDVQFDVVKVINPDEYEGLEPNQISKMVYEIMDKAVKHPSTDKEKVRLY